MRLRLGSARLPTCRHSRALVPSSQSNFVLSILSAPMTDRLFLVEVQNHTRRCGQQHCFRSRGRHLHGTSAKLRRCAFK